METLKKYIAIKEHRHFCEGDVVEIRSKVVDVPAGLDPDKFGKKAIEVEAFISYESGKNHFLHHYNSTMFADLLNYLKLAEKKDADT